MSQRSRQSLREVDLLVGRVIVGEEFPEAGWVGMVTRDSNDHEILELVLTIGEMRSHVWNLFKNHGEHQSRQQIERYRPDRSRNRVFFVPRSEAKARGDARAIMVSQIARR